MIKGKGIELHGDANKFLKLYLSSTRGVSYI